MKRYDDNLIKELLDIKIAIQDLEEKQKDCGRQIRYYRSKLKSCVQLRHEMTKKLLKRMTELEK